MSRRILSHQANSDLEAIIDFIAMESIQGAERVLSEFEETFVLLSRHPEIGHKRLDLVDNEELQFWPVRSYLLVYRVLSGGPEVARIVDGRRDVPRVLGEAGS